MMDDQKDILAVSGVLAGRGHEAKPTTANWKRAFIALALVLSREWTASDQLSRYVDVVRQAAGDEPADFLTKLFNSTRTKFMQDFMG